MKLSIIFANNEIYNKTILCLLALIYNENVETIFKFLKNNFNFNPNLLV